MVTTESTSVKDRPIPIMIKFWAGSESFEYRYIKRSLRSLFASDLPASVRIIFVDDQSTDRRVTDLVNAYARRDSRVDVWRNPERMGPNRGQEYNFPRVVERYPDAAYFMLCDDDVIYHPGWLQRLVRVSEEAAERGLVGVFSALNVPARPAYGHVRLPTSEVLLKQRQMALNWLVPHEVYRRVGPFRDVGVAYDTDYTNRLMALNMPVVCLKPSYVQNIGYFGAYQNSDELRAHDYVGSRDLWLIARDVAFMGWRLAERANETTLGKMVRPYLKALLGRR
jgi:glycosyltransferase involved in cell wall biosynthesis